MTVSALQDSEVLHKTLAAVVRYRVEYYSEVLPNYNRKFVNFEERNYEFAELLNIGFAAVAAVAVADEV